jgi:glycosyltransferase involved in cell wall biosynthesis
MSMRAVAPWRGDGALPQDERLDLSIVMPCLNEARSLGYCIERAQASLVRLGVRGEVLIADNGSNDGSQSIARRMGARVVDVPDRGYGTALKGGISAARGEFVIMGDADGSYDFSRLEPFLAQLRGGHDIVLGNRFDGGIAEGAMPLLHRRLGNPLLTRIARRVSGSTAGDVYCGLRGFRKGAVEALNLRCSGMEFALEMVVKAALSGLSVTEVPTTLSPDRRGRPAHLRTWRDGCRSMRVLGRFSPHLFLGSRRARRHERDRISLPARRARREP